MLVKPARWKITLRKDPINSKLFFPGTVHKRPVEPFSRFAGISLSILISRNVKSATYGLKSPSTCLIFLEEFPGNRMLLGKNQRLEHYVLWYQHAVGAATVAGRRVPLHSLQTVPLLTSQWDVVWRDLTRLASSLGSTAAQASAAFSYSHRLSDPSTEQARCVKSSIFKLVSAVTRSALR